MRKIPIWISYCPTVEDRLQEARLHVVEAFHKALHAHLRQVPLPLFGQGMLGDRGEVIPEPFLTELRQARLLVHTVFLIADSIVIAAQ